MFFADRVAPKYHSYTLDGGSHITHYNPLSLLFLFLPFVLTTVSGAFLQYGSTRLFDSPSKVTLTVGATERSRVYCAQPEAIGAVPTSIQWYNPQGQLVSTVGGDEVNQVVGFGGGRTSFITFQSYNQSQGGKYECRVASPGNKLDKLSVCIGECHAWGDDCGLLSIIELTSLPGQSSNIHGQGHTKSYLWQTVFVSPINRETIIE